MMSRILNYFNSFLQNLNLIFVYFKFKLTYFKLNLSNFKLFLTFFNLIFTIFNLISTYFNLFLTYFNLLWTYFNLILTYFNLIMTFFNLILTFLNLNLTYFNLRVKRCSSLFINTRLLKLKEWSITTEKNVRGLPGPGPKPRRSMLINIEHFFIANQRYQNIHREKFSNINDTFKRITGIPENVHISTGIF